MEKGVVHNNKKSVGIYNLTFHNHKKDKLHCRIVNQTGKMGVFAVLSLLKDNFSGRQMGVPIIHDTLATVFAIFAGFPARGKRKKWCAKHVSHT